MDHIKPFKPGDIVICSEHPELGEAKITCLQQERGAAFLVWGKFGIMSDRTYALVDVSTLSRPKRERKRIPIKKRQ